MREVFSLSRRLLDVDRDPRASFCDFTGAMAYSPLGYSYPTTPQVQPLPLGCDQHFARVCKLSDFARLFDFSPLLEITTRNVSVQRQAGTLAWAISNSFRCFFFVLFFCLVSKVPDDTQLTARLSGRRDASVPLGAALQRPPARLERRNRSLRWLVPEEPKLLQHQRRHCPVLESMLLFSFF